MSFFWTLRMTYWIKWYGCEKTWTAAYWFARDPAWREYREDGYSPREAIIEDLGHT